MTLALGMGFHEISHERERLFVLIQETGQPVADRMGTLSMMRTMVLFHPAPRGEKVLTSFCEHVMGKYASTSSPRHTITVFRFNVCTNRWDSVCRKAARPLSSVVLPLATKRLVVNDLKAHFLSHAIKWYAKHGIPYKRSLLFYGVPGSGKTSFIQAPAGKFRRNVCFLMPTDPRFTDDSFAAAIKRAPINSFIVIEDVDALFDEDRAKKGDAALTFTGLLNGLDGIGNPDGQIFVLTTNFVERLDAALIRKGRVDLHVEFGNATREQIEGIFCSFYHDSYSPDVLRQSS